MTRIEDLLRQTLTEGPLPDSTYPASTLRQRVSRARRRVAAGATLTVAAAVAAIVVPLAAFGGQSAQRVVSPTLPSPSASASTPAAPSGVSAGVSWVSGASGGTPWALLHLPSTRCPGCTNPVLSRVGPFGVEGTRYPVTFGGIVVATPDLVWVVGGVEDKSWVSVLDIATGSVTNKVFANDHLTGGSADGDDLYVANQTTWQVSRLSFTDNKIVVRGSVTLPANVSIGDIVTTSAHDIWVNDGTKLVELVPTATGVRTAGTVDWGGQGMWGPVVYGPGNPSPGAPSLWAWDGRLIDLTPSYLHDGSSVAQGYRIPLPGVPTYALSTPAGGVFIGVGGAPPSTGTSHVGLYYFSPAALRDGTSRPTAHLRTGQVTSMALDPAGGVFATVGTSKSKLMRWHPAGS
jgi:hypothetical protein